MRLKMARKNLNTFLATFCITKHCGDTAFSSVYYTRGSLFSAMNQIYVKSDKPTLVLWLLRRRQLRTSNNSINSQDLTANFPVIWWVITSTKYTLSCHIVSCRSSPPTLQNSVSAFRWQDSVTTHWTATHSFERRRQPHVLRNKRVVIRAQESRKTAQFGCVLATNRSVFHPPYTVDSNLE
jgi:hypothetical protein